MCLILTATLKVKTLGKIVALLGVCGRIGKNDAQNKTIRDLLVKKITNRVTTLSDEMEMSLRERVQLTTV